MMGKSRKVERKEDEGGKKEGQRRMEKEEGGRKRRLEGKRTKEGGRK